MWGTSIRRAVQWAACGVFCGGLVTAAAAQDAAPSQAEIDQAFRRTLAAPQDLDASYAYAQLLVRAGNYEGAAAALERMLLIDGTQYQLLLELGVLYFRLGSYELARDYLERAAQAPGATEETKATARRYLADIERKVSLHHLTGSLLGGLRYQSNANGGIAGTDLRSFGISVPRPVATKPVDDGNGFLLGTIEHAYDLQTQNEAAIVTQAFGYGTRQFNQTTTNLGVIEATSGVRFTPLREFLPGLGIRPHVVLGAVSLDDRHYSTTYGPGVDVYYKVSERTAWQMTYQMRFTDYNNNPTTAEAARLGGNENLARVTLVHEVFNNLTFIGGATYHDADTQRIYFDYQSVGVSGAFIVRYGVPFMETPWATSIGLSHTYFEYRGADPTVDPNTQRRDREWRVGLTNEIPFSVAQQQLVFQQTFEWDRNFSNIPNYGRDNKLVSVGLGWRF